MARIENHNYSIEEAFRECFYIAPDYQREYVWTDKGYISSELLEDIGEQIDTGTAREYSSARYSCRRQIRKITTR